MTSDVNINSVLTGQQKTSSATTKLDEDFTQFLTLLTTQIQNQDPLSPMDSTEFTNQLVNFTGVEQQINTNSKLDSLLALSVGNAFSSSLGYVGKDISYLSSEANFDGQKDVKISYAVSEGTPVSTKLYIFDQDDKLVLSKDLSNTTGVKEFTWDGKNTDGTVMPAGTYKIRVDALDQDDKGLKTTTVVNGRVKGIETQNGVTMLLVGSRAVSIGNVINVIDPNAENNSTTDTQQNTTA
jgi:flagellar basal-body rod modification protein FlgD